MTRDPRTSPSKLGVTLRLARVKPAVREVLERDGVLDRIGDDKIHGNVDHAVEAQLAASGGNRAGLRVAQQSRVRGGGGGQGASGAVGGGCGRRSGRAWSARRGILDRVVEVAALAPG